MEVVTDKSMIITLAIPVFFLLIIIEYFYGRYVGKNTYRLNDTVTSITVGMISRFPTMLNLGVQSVIFVYISSYLNMELLSVKNPFTWIIAFLLYDLSYYWMHRMHHEIKILWATHSVHHHGEDYNLATALRQTSTGWLWKWIFYMPMIILGVPGEVFITVAGINLVYQFWVHTEHIGHLGFLEKIFITPMNHRIHHAKNKEYIDANYGGVFIIWDRMFGTYNPQRSDIKPVYGTATPLNSWNPLWANFQVFSIMIKDTIKTKSWKDKIKVWFSKTYWRPEDCIEEKNPNEFYKKFNPEITTDIKLFSFFQMLFTILVSGAVITFISNHAYSEIITFGLFIIALTSLTGYLMQSNTHAYQLILYFSVISIFSILYFELLSFELLSTKLLLAQLLANTLAVTGIRLFQSLTFSGLLKVK
jgi:sterol desaturase/sphingolipid hydroxylase (fatty acid hydroxylase superfamily)|tara:strand:+ start:2415 stop:3668 length:1254 start_codon:yes stop_codon:yes gene_type:complete